jgi:PAS domain S-box-containing protein
MNIKSDKVNTYTDSFLISNNCKVSDIGSGFLELTGYSYDEIIDLNIYQVFTNLLRIQQQTFELIDIKENVECFIFTKPLIAREVIISITQGQNVTEKIYTINEKLNSRLENNFQYIEQLYKHNTTGIAIYKAEDYILLKANQTFLNFLDEPYDNKKNSIGRSLNDFCTGWKGSAANEMLKKVIETGEPYIDNEFAYNGFIRGLTYCDITIIPIIENEKVKFIFETARDVTDVVLNKKYILEQKEIIKQQKLQLESIVENMMDKLSVCDKDGKFLFNNSSTRNIAKGFKKIKKAGDITHIYKFKEMGGCIIPLENMTMKRALKGELVNNFKMSLEEGGNKRCFITKATSIYQNNELKMAMSFSSEITELVKAQEEVYRQKEILETVIENINKAFVVYDNEGNLILKNAEARKLYSHPEILKTIKKAHKSFQYFDLEDNEIPIEKLPSNKALKGEVIKNEIIKIKRGKKFQITEVNVTPIYYKSGNLMCIASFHRDITEAFNNQKFIKMQQQQLLESEKQKNEILHKAIEMKDEFLSLISHEFKTPLTVINSALQAMELICKDELSDKVKKYHNSILQNSNRQLKLVNNLLDITRLTSGHLKLSPKNIDIIFLTRLIIESIRIIAEQKQIEIIYKSTLASYTIGIDDEKYERILLNLLSNAIKFTPKGKSIIVRLSLKKVKGKGMISVSVKDRGIGIPDDKRELIFTRFGQVNSSLARHSEGSGIGLSLVKMLVELMNGEISLKSKEGEGSNFIIFLPSEIINDELEEKIKEISDSRLIQATAIEFSDIYY